jgi:hypothetical protein
MKHFNNTLHPGKLTFLLLIFLFISFSSTGQITITTDDMPNVGDTIRLSNNIATIGIDYTLTGENYTWDFSTLFPVTQSVDTFASVSSVPFLYQLVFFPNIVANLAKPFSTFNLIPGLEVDDPYLFYMNSNSNYKDVGFAVTFNSIPMPVKYDNPDILYDFPVNYGNADSSYSGFELGLPEMGFAGIDRKRVNTVDGWGTLITPYGTFDALRIKSHVLETDTIYIDSISFGTTIDRDYIEYKWMGNGKGLPLLQVTEEFGLITVTYIDSVRNPVTAIPETEMTELSVSIYPNPAKGHATISFATMQPGITNIAIYNLAGIKVKEILNGKLTKGRHEIMLATGDIPDGIYLIRVVSPENIYTEKLVVR